MKGLSAEKSDSFTSEISQPQYSFLLIYIIVPLLLIMSSAVMATAWLGHLKFKEDLSFWTATFFAWFLVLPEYALNIKALRIGYQKYTAGQMAAFRLCSGVVCIAFVSHYILDEVITIQKFFGFALMIIAMVLIYDSKE